MEGSSTPAARRSHPVTGCCAAARADVDRRRATLPAPGMAAKRVAVIQSSYVPWKGYFDLIRAADQFVLLDDVQFTKRDWRSRNRIKTADGPLGLSIPLTTK